MIVVNNNVSPAHLAVKIKAANYDENRAFFKKAETNESIGMTKVEWQDYLDNLKTLYESKMQVRMDCYTILTPRKSNAILSDIKRVTRLLNN